MRVRSRLSERQKEYAVTVYSGKSAMTIQNKSCLPEKGRRLLLLDPSDAF